MTLLLATGDLGCLLLVSFGFLFLVAVEIGSLALFMCFSYVDLSSNFKSFLPEYCVFFVDVFFKFIMEKIPITPIIFEVIQLSEWIKH